MTIAGLKHKVISTLSLNSSQPEPQRIKQENKIVSYTKADTAGPKFFFTIIQYYAVFTIDIVCFIVGLIFSTRKSYIQPYTSLLQIVYDTKANTVGP